MSEQRNQGIDLAIPHQPHQGGAGGAREDSKLGEIEQRLARLEERTAHLATKEDLQKMQTELVNAQNRQLRWVIGGMGAALLAACSAWLA